MMNKYPKVMIAHAINRPEFTKSFYQGMLQTLYSYPGEIAVRVAEGHLAGWGRNSLINDFVKTDADYIFFIDSDTGVPHEGLKKLVEHQKDIVSGLYFQRYPPYNPTFKKLQKNEFGNDQYLPILDYPEGLVEVDMVGAGCLLISRRVCENLMEPYFFSPEQDYTEDTYFCLQAKKAGFSIYVDTTVKCLHDTAMTVDEVTFSMYKLRKGK